MNCSSEDEERPRRYQSRAGPSHHREESFDDEEDEEHYTRFDHQYQKSDISTDDAITMLLSSLRFESHRQQMPSDRDDDALRRIHEKLYTQIQREPDDAKRRRLKKALPASNCVREQVYYLRRRPAAPSPSYFHRLSAQLDAIVKDSFEEEYRKVAIILGLVEALAEVLILELTTFGVPQVNCDEHRTIRKLIANALTNLTYGQIHSKRRLCSYDGFVRCMIRIILESTNLTQVYAGLVRNLSWMADPEMSEALRPTVHALAIAAVRANKNREEGCVKATLSALWNLASHSADNKRTICDTPNCLVVLANLLSTDVRQTAIVDSATGILKYVSQYLATTSTHLELRPILLTRLISLLGSSSFTIVTNTLGAIANLISKDPHLQNALRHDMSAFQQLNILRNSNRDDIRAAVKIVLNAVNQPNIAAATTTPASSARYAGEMTTSLTISPRMLPLRATMASPGRFAATMDPRSCSLPRHFGQQAQNVQHHQQPPQPEPHHVNEINDDMIEIQSETAMGTRSNSVRSLGSVDPGSVMNTGGWNSTIDTAANSSRALSPVSFSDLPASPTMCGTAATVTPQVFSEQQTPVFNQQILMAQPMTFTTTGSANTCISSGQNTINNTMTTSLVAAGSSNAVVVDTNLDSPDDVLPGPSFGDDGDYAIIQNIEKNSDLLNRSIQAEMPAKSKVSPRLNGFFSPTSSRNQASPHLLMESIMSEMPGGSKNVEADHRESNQQNCETESRGELKIGTKIGSQSLESQEYTTSEEDDDDDDDMDFPRYQNSDSEIQMMIDSSIPVDCYAEEDDEEETDFEDLNATHFEGDVTIDCREFRETSTPKGSSTHLRKTRLPVPKTNGIMKKTPSPQYTSKIARPRLPPKPKTLLNSKLGKDCSFYEEDGVKDQTIYVNAPASVENQEIYENMRKNTPSNTEKQMLVTTV